MWEMSPWLSLSDICGQSRSSAEGSRARLCAPVRSPARARYVSTAARESHLQTFVPYTCVIVVRGHLVSKRNQREGKKLEDH